MKKTKVRIVGILLVDDEKCVFCYKNPARILISSLDGEFDQEPACNSCVGPGCIGEKADLIEVEK